MLHKKKNGIPSMRSREYREGGKTVAVSITYIKWTFISKIFVTSIAQSAERQSMDRWIPSSNPGSDNHFFFIIFFYLEVIFIFYIIWVGNTSLICELYVKMAVLYENVMNFLETLKVLYWKNIILWWNKTR